MRFLFIKQRQFQYQKDKMFFCNNYCMCYSIIVTVIQIESESFSNSKLKSASLSQANGKLWIDP
jgi:hypothetical protein